RSMLGDDRGGRRLVPTQSVSRVGVWDRLHLGSVALELRRTRRRTKLALSLPVSMLKAQKHHASAEGDDWTQVVHKSRLANPSGRAAHAARPRRRSDRMIQCHSTGHPAASSVPRWLTICLQWLLFQQMHYHGSESRVMPLRGIELFLSTREKPLRMINRHLNMVFCRPADQTAQRISLTIFPERYGSVVGLVVSDPI